jgi:methylenetetrahydrofolate reductase (NADPH)
MNQRTQDLAVNSIDRKRVHATIVQLAREASIEINVQDEPHLRASQKLLPAGTRIYVSHLPKQTWQATVDACRAVRAAGFDPAPHVPVRLLADAETFDRLLGDFVAQAQVRDLLLISGDYPQPVGPFATTSELLRTGLLAKHGIRNVSVAGHPEGHPKVAVEEIRRAENEKAALAQQSGLQLSFLTQFFFEHAPFLSWVEEMRRQGITARIIGGLAGPAGLATLFKFAVRCGAGPSIRALGARPTSLMKLVGERGPESVLRGLAEARAAGTSDFTGVHLFCFGGYLRTCEWLHAVAEGRFTLDDRGGFEVKR